MSILIKDMEMPTSCYKCPMRRRDGMDLVCPIAHERFSVADVNILEYRLKNCPLVPVPPHGRLIDADALIVDLMDRGVESLQMDDWYEIQQAVAEAPTIIPAEEGEWTKRRFSEICCGFKCSVCHTTWDCNFYFCPNCGAKITEVSDG